MIPTFSIEPPTPPLSSAGAPSLEKWRENGERERKRGNRGGGVGGGQGDFGTIARFFSPLPIPQPTGKTKETSAEERDPPPQPSRGQS